MAWQVLTGVVEWWADEVLREAGRRSRRPGGDAASAAAAIPGEGVDVARAVFVARRVPWRLSKVSLGPADDAVTPAVASWADDAAAILKGHPAKQHVVGAHQTWGDLGVRLMLEPMALRRFVSAPWPARFRVEGHLLEDDPSAAPEFVSVDAEYHEARYRPELDVITSWTAVIDGEPAQRITLNALTALDATGRPA